MTMRELLSLARRVELRVGRLYEHMARDFAGQEELTALLHTLARQEREHAQMVESAMEQLDQPHDEALLEGEVFLRFLDTIDEIEDEVCTEGLTVPAAVEVMHHLESSVAERFYGRLGDASPGMDPAFIRRMIDSSRAHLRQVEDFRRKVGHSNAHPAP